MWRLRGVRFLGEVRPYAGHPWGEARRTLLFARVARMPDPGDLSDVRHYPTRPHLRRRAAPNLLSQGHEFMALFGRDRDEGTGAPRAIPVPVMPVDGIAPGEVAMFERERNTSQLAGPGGIDTFLGRGTKVNGKLVLEGTARIEGQVEGEISARDALTVGEGAVVNAKISGTSIVIEGGVTGDVTARERLELRASGRVRGSVTTASLVVHEGALLDGRCSMGGGEATARREKPTTTAPVSANRRAPDPPVPVPAAASR